ncbi:MAG TPA: hypothetical protein V6D09_18035 [Leptolyngbyaceae cyanobacterium]
MRSQPFLILCRMVKFNLDWKLQCPVEEQSPHDPRYFQQMLSQQSVSVAPLLWNHIQQLANQLRLF